MSGWIVRLTEMTDSPHVVPIDDLKDHEPGHERDPGSCWCHPTFDEDVWVHHAMDQREAYERGERLPS